MTEREFSNATEEIKRAFYAYEDALTHNRLDEINSFFFSSSATARFGASASEHQYGYDAIVRGRLARGPVKSPERRLTNVHVEAVGEDVGLAHAEFVSEGSDAIGRQSQTWLRTPNGWKIVSAHVSLGIVPAASKD